MVNLIKEKKSKSIKNLSIAQIIILVLGTIAIAYAIGSSVGEVEATLSYSFVKKIVETQSKQPSATDIVQNTQAAKAFFDQKAAESVAAKTASKAPVPVDKAASKAAKTAGESATKTAATKTTGEVAKETFWNSMKTNLGQIVKDAGIASLIYTGIGLLGPLVTSDQQAIKAAQKAASIGFLVGHTTDNVVGLIAPQLGKKIGTFLGKKIFLGLTGGFWIGAAVAVAVFLYSYKKTEELRVQYTCNVWDAPTGGKNCEKCNEGVLPCTEYQCRSLGQACELLNPGTSEEKCAWVNPKDVNPPVIRAWQDALLNADYSYTPDNRASPQDPGVYIQYKKGCIPAFTPFQFGIVLDEPAKCKVDTIRKETYDSMNMFFGGSSTLKYNHTQLLTLPSPDALADQNITLDNGGNFALYVRCQDANGNPAGDSPSSTFVFKYCVDEGPDTTPPLIVSTNLLSGLPIAFNQSELNLEVYVNEPAECRWQHDHDTSFSTMEETMQCSKSIFEMNAQLLYKCTTTLTGIKDRQQNRFYFRCKDKPTANSDRNENIEGYEFVVIGTQPLLIDSSGPNGIVKDSTATVKVTLEAETMAGYKDGDATCYYSESCYKESGSKDNNTAFYYATGTSSHTHSQDLWLVPGTYDCMIKCFDLGGNVDNSSVSYTVETDEQAPIVVRAYKENTKLKIITQEEGECVYGINDCSYQFDDGIKMTTYDSFEHYSNWDEDKTYFVKCKDKFGNEPYPNECSFIARPSKDFSK